MKKQFITIQDGIKDALKVLNEDEVLEATKKYAGVAKNKAYFYKCAEGKAHDIHHKYSLALDIACIQKEKAPSMLKAHEAMIEKYFDKNPDTTAEEMTLYLGQLMEDVGRLTSTVVYGLEDEIEEITRTFKLGSKKQEHNLIDALKIVCRKFSKEKTGKKPFTNINLVRI